MSYHPTGRYEYVSLKNATDVPRKFTIGSIFLNLQFEVNDRSPIGTYDELDFQPFVLTEEVQYAISFTR